MPAINHYPPIVTSDDIPARTITLERVVGGLVQSLAGATIKFEILRRGKVYVTYDNGANGGVTVVDEPNAIARFGPYETDALTPADYDYAIQVTWADGFEKTMVAGGLKIIKKQFGEYQETGV